MADSTISATSGESAPAQADSIWLTRTSVKPFWLALSLMLTLVGLFAFWPLMVAAGVTSLLIAWSWLNESRADSEDLPRG
ncbi:MAG: hypothetical protein WAP35_04110 [Solirubrobacterales bacterium]